MTNPVVESVNARVIFGAAVSLRFQFRALLGIAVNKLLTSLMLYSELSFAHWLARAADGPARWRLGSTLGWREPGGKSWCRRRGGNIIILIIIIIIIPVVSEFGQY